MKLLRSLCLLFFCMCAAQADTPEHPEYAVVPLPDGANMEFSLIRVSDGNNVFSAREVFIGNQKSAEEQDAQGYDAAHVRTYVSGSVYVPPSENRPAGCWVLPMSRTEVTCAQYAAVMNEKLAAGEAPDKPKVGLTYAQVVAFMEKLSALCLNRKCATGKTVQELALPALKRPHGALYARLPLEREWEFAARGALYVSETDFQNNHPYGDTSALLAAENLHTGGITALRAVKQGLGEHPCGLYDMLGNAAELVADSYQPEYRLGRAGGLLVRGGDFSTAAEQATSFLRRELPLYQKDGSPASYKATGFRVVLGSDVVAVPALRLINGKDGSGRRPVRRPDEFDSSSADSLSRDLSGNTTEISRQLNLISRQMSNISGAESINTPAANTLEQHFSTIQNQLETMSARVQNASNQLAFSGLLICDTHTATALAAMAEQLLAQQSLDKLPAGARSVKLFRRKIERSQQILNADWDKVSRGFSVMAQADAAAILSQIDARRKELEKTNPDQLRSFDMVVKHFRKYQQTGNTSGSARDNWLQDLREIAKIYLEEK